MRWLHGLTSSFGKHVDEMTPSEEEVGVAATKITKRKSIVGKKHRSDPDLALSLSLLKRSTALNVAATGKAVKYFRPALEIRRRRCMQTLEGREVCWQQILGESEIRTTSTNIITGMGIWLNAFWVLNCNRFDYETSIA